MTVAASVLAQSSTDVAISQWIERTADSDDEGESLPDGPSREDDRSDFLSVQWLLHVSDSVISPRSFRCS